METDIRLLALKMASIALAIVCLMILCPVIMIGQAFPGISPVEMTVSFMPQVLLLSPVAVAGLLFHNLRAALLGGGCQGSVEDRDP